MEIDPTTIVPWLQSGAAIIGTTLVSEATKDAYKAFKGKVGELFGASASSAIDNLERDPRDPSASALLATAVSALSDAHKVALSPLLEALAEAFKADASARDTVLTKGHVKLDFDAKGNITIARVSGASLMTVKARSSDGDVSFTDVAIDRGSSSGN